MKLKEPLKIVSLDLEATGVDTDNDRIIEIGLSRYQIYRLSPVPIIETIESCSQFINPEIEIPVKIQELTGIRNSDVENQETFSQISKYIHELLSDCYITGFNILAYDIPLLISEFARCGITWLPDKSKVIDTFCIYRSMEPRDLQSALKFYSGIKHETSHRALDDAEDAFAVLLGQSNRYQSEDHLNDISKMAEFSTKGLLDFQKKFILNDEGKPTFNFGKSKGQSVFDNVGMLEWMLDKQFSSDTKRWAKKFIDEYRVKEKSELPF